MILMVTSASLSRVIPAADDIAASATMVRERSAGVFGLLVDVKPDALPPNVQGALSDMFQTTTSDWSAENRNAAFEKLQRWRRARAPEFPGGTRVAVPYIVVALTEAEALSMDGDPESFFKAFGPGAALRRTEFDGLSKRLLEVSQMWPKGFYGGQRNQWRLFGPATQTSSGSDWYVTVDIVGPKPNGPSVSRTFCQAASEAPKQPVPPAATTRVNRRICSCFSARA